MSSNTNIGNTPVNQGYVQLIHTGETGGIDGTLRTLYDGDGTASDLQIASNAVKISTQLYIGSKTITEYVQDVVGDMFDTNGSHTNITATYDDDGDGAIDLVATGAISSITGGTGIDVTGSGNITIAIDSTVATKTYVDTEVAGLVDSAPGTLDTLNELAAALGDDPNFATTTATNIATKLAKASNLSDLTNASTARTNLGVAIGSDVQAYDAGLQSISGLTTAADKIIYTTASDTYAVTDLTSTARTLLDDTSIGAMRTTLGLGLLAIRDTVGIEQFLAADIQTSSELVSPGFSDDDDSLMTAAAINDRIESFGYGTGTMSSWTLEGDSGSTTVTNTDTVDIAGGTGITTVASLDAGRDTVTINFSAGIDDLSDVLITSVSNGQVLKYSSAESAFVNQDEDTGISFNGSTANGLLTYGNSTTADVESELTYNGAGQLEINRSGSNAILQLRSDTNNTRIHFKENTDVAWNIGYDATNNWFSFYDASVPATPVKIKDGAGSDTLVVDSTSRVGIGTTSPQSILHVGTGNTARHIKVSDSRAMFGYNGVNAIVQGGNTKGLQFHTNTDTFAGNPKMTITTAGDVGIGTNSPGVKLDVAGGDIAIDSTQKLYLDGGNGTYVHELSDNVIEFRTDNNPQLKIDNNAGVIINDGSYASFDFRVESNNNTHMLFVDSGTDRVGIGTTSPGRTLQVNGDGVIRLVNDSGDAGIDFNSSDMQLRYRSASDKLQFYSYGTSSNVMTIQKSNGFVGIGTESPGHSLHVYHTANYEALKIETNTGGALMRATDSAGTTETGTQGGNWVARTNNTPRLTINSTGTATFGGQVNIGGALTGVNGLYGASNTLTLYNNTYNFKNASSGDMMTLNSNGLGIGVLPSQQLHVAGSVRADTAYYVDGNIVINTDGNFEVHDTRAVTPSTDIGLKGVRFDFKNNSADGLSDGGSYHGVMTFQQWNDTSGGHIHALGFTDNGYVHHRNASIGGTFGNWKKLIQEDNSGNVGIGGSPEGNAKLDIKMSGVSQYLKLERSSSSGRAQIQLANESGGELWRFGTTGGGSEDFAFWDGSFNHLVFDRSANSAQFGGSVGINVTPSGTSGRLDCSNDVVAYSTSDKRLKENIKPLDSALDKVLKISGVSFDWKELTEEEKKTIHGNKGHDVGVIAQEIEEVLPEVVTTRDSGYKAVKYEKIVPLLIEAIKEQQQQINELKEQLNG